MKDRIVHSPDSSRDGFTLCGRAIYNKKTEKTKHFSYYTSRVTCRKCKRLLAPVVKQVV